jgi:xylono-1,5-lactonase
MSQAAQLWMPSHHRLGESIIWHVARQCFFWVDLLDPALFCHDPATGKTEKQDFTLPPPIGSIAATTNPDVLVLAHRGGLSLLDLRSMAFTPYCDPERGRDSIIYNDIKVDRWGRLWVGTSHEKELESRGALWCVESRSRWALADSGFAISNGPAFSPDGRTLYFNDSVGRTTLAYDLSPEHLAVRNRRTLIKHVDNDGLPDGVTVDANGDIWTAQWAGSAVLRFDSDGKLKDRISVPSVHVTTLCFGGHDLDQIRVTTATDGAMASSLRDLPLSGGLFKLEGAGVGVAEPLFPV